MKKVLLIVAFVAIGLVSCKKEKKDKVEAKQEVEVKQEVKVVDKGNVNIADSKLTWKGTKPTGAHDGDVRLERGSLTVENGIVKAGEFVIDMNSINTLDLKAGDGKEDLDGHLKNADFFDVAKYPTAKFVVTSSEKKDGKLAVTGNLTIKEVTKSITIPATVSEADGVITFKSDVFKVDRTDFGVKYKSKNFVDGLKDKFIDDLIEFSFEVKAKK